MSDVLWFESAGVDSCVIVFSSLVELLLSIWILLNLNRTRFLVISDSAMLEFMFVLIIPSVTMRLSFPTLCPTAFPTFVTSALIAVVIVLNGCTVA
jgi:hypothetical protein